MQAIGDVWSEHEHKPETWICKLHQSWKEATQAHTLNRREIERSKKISSGRKEKAFSSELYYKTLKQNDIVVEFLKS